MSTSTGRTSGIVRRWAAAAVLGGSTILATGCSLIPTWEDVRSVSTTVKDQVTGKARQDRMNKTYSEARLLERRKDFAGAESLYRELLREEPRSRDCYHRLGVIAAQQTKYDEAHQHYQTALQCSTPTPDLWSDVGYCFYLQNKLPEAEQALQQALALQPQHRAALNNLAMVVGEQGRIDEAYDLFRRGNNEAEAEQNIGFLCAACGELEQAQGHFSRALSVNPDMKQAAEALLQVTQAMQRRQDMLAQNPQMRDNSLQQSGGNPSAVTPAGGFPDPGAAQNGVVPAVGAQNSSYGDVRQISAQMPPANANGPTRRLIEVFSGGPRSAAASAQIAARSHAASGDAISPAAQPQTVPWNPQPAANAAQSGMPQMSASGAFNYPNMPQPQYLQPMNSAPSQVMAHTAQAPGAGRGNASSALSNAIPNNAGLPAMGNGAAPGAFPSFVGGETSR